MILLNINCKLPDIMKQNIILLLTFVSLTSNTSAEDPAHKKKIIVHFDSGYSESLSARGTYEDSFNGSLLFGAGVKVEVAPKIKMGISLLHRGGFKYDKVYFDPGLPPQTKLQNLKVTTLMYNASYDIYKIMDMFTTFIEGGVGISRIDPGQITITEGSVSETSYGGGIRYTPAWNIGGGVSMDLIKNTSISATYKFNYLGKTTAIASDEQIQGKIKANEFLVSLGFSL